MGYVYDDSRGTGRKVYGIAFNDVDGSWIRRREPEAKKLQAGNILKAEERAVTRAKEEGFPSLQAMKDSDRRKSEEAKRAAVTFENFKPDYIESLEEKIKEGRFKATTLSRYQDLLRLYIVPFFGKELLTKIDADRIEEFKRTRIKAGAAASTVCQEISIISGLFTLALKRKKIPSHPVWGLVEKPRLPNRTPRYLKPDEIERLLAEVEEPLKSAILIAMNTGLRESELAGLTWKDIDKQRQTITIPGDRRKSGRPLVIPYEETVAEVLEYLENLPIRFKSPYVITNPRKKSKYDRFNNTAWRKAVRDAGLKFRWHDLRSHYGSMLAHNGAGADKIQALLGQSSLASTQKYIVHSPESLRGSVKAADGRNLKSTTPIATPKPEVAGG